ncbi:MAG: ABC transporter ATP-binding protein [Gemmatimonadales bacterium]
MREPKPQIATVPGGAAASPTGPGVGFYCQDVSYAYDGRRGALLALDGVSFNVRPSEFVCVVGPSGCGKSTLLRIIAGLNEPTAGRVMFEGGVDSARPRGGLVFQEHGTFPWMTVLDNVAFGLEMQGVGREERRERAMTYIHRVGLAAFARHYPHELSVGMRQRVGIGRAFVADAPVLLMDEPFGSLDAQTRWVLQGELLRIWAEHKKLVVFVTHDIEEAVLLGDRVLVMTGHPGRILEEIRVPLPRPRDLPRDQHRIGEITWHIWQLLEQEVRSGLSVR